MQIVKERSVLFKFDAHHDLRNLDDGGPSNGTPFRSLLENGVITGKQLVQIGIRNFSNAHAYHEYAKEHGVTVYTMKDVREREIKDIMTESIEVLRKQGVTSIYISLDMDVARSSIRARLSSNWPWRNG